MPGSADAVPRAAPSADAPVWGPVFPVQLRPGKNQGEVGHGLARSARRGTTFLHAVTLAEDYVAETSVASYGRSASNGAAWSQRVRLTPTSHLVGQVAVAASGKRVYAAWSRTGSRHRSGSMYVRINERFGRSTAWRPATRLGELTGRVVAIAATGSTVFVTGRVGPRVVLWTSRDGGHRWTTTRLGSTTQDSDGAPGPTAVAASGSLVVVGWTRGNVNVKVRISRDGGRHWSAAHESGRSSLSVAALGDRVAVSGTTNNDNYKPETSWVQIWRRGVWKPLRVVPTTGVFAWGCSVFLHGRTAVGVVYRDYTVPVGVGDYQHRLVWRTSADGGASWSAPVTVVDALAYASGVIWRAGGAVHVLFTRYLGEVVLPGPGGITWTVSRYATAIRSRS